MRLHFIALLVFVLFLLPAAAWGATRTFDAGRSGWGPITTVDGAGADGAITAADDVVIPNGAVVHTAASLVPSTGSVTVGSGGRWVINPQLTDDDVMLYVNLGTTATAITVESGGELEAQGCYQQVGVSAPQCVTDRTPYNYTTWYVGDIGPCTAASGTPGASGDCTVDSNGRYFWIYWTDEQQADDLEIDTAIAEIEVFAAYESRAQLCFFDDDLNDDYIPSEAGRCYPISEIDSSVSPYGIEIDLAQVGNRYEVQTGYPGAIKWASGLATEENVAKGDTCVEFDAALTVFNGVASLTADNQHVGRYIWSDGWDMPLMIKRSRNARDCADAAGNDAVYTDAPIPVALTAATERVVIMPGIRRGDPFFIMMPVRFLDLNGSGTTDGDIDIDGTVSFGAVSIEGAGVVDLTNATISKWKDVIVRDSGATASVIFSGNTSVSIDGLHMTGGEAAGGVDHINIGNVTGTTCFANISSQFGGGDVIETTAASGRFIGRHITCAFVPTDNSTSSCIDDANGYFSHAAVTDIRSFNSIGAGGTTFKSGTSRFTIDRALIVGNAGALGSGSGLWMRNIRAFNLYGSHATPMPPRISRCEIIGLSMTISAGINDTNSNISRCIFDDFYINVADMWYGGAGSRFTDNIVIDPDTSAVAAAANDLFSYTFDGDSTTVDVFERNTIVFSGGSTMNFAQVFDETSLSTEATDGFRIGGNAIIYADSDLTGANATGINIAGAQVADEVDAQAGPNCFFANDCNDGTCNWLDVPAEAVDDWGNDYKFGYAPQFVDPAHRRFELTSSSSQAQMDCGARPGFLGAGIYGARTGWLYSIMGQDAPDKKPMIFRQEE